MKSPTIGLTRLSDSAGHHVGPEQQPHLLLATRALTIDRSANAWMIPEAGLLRIPLSGKGLVGADKSLSRDELTFSPAVGMSGSILFDIFEDREGNMWVATEGGLDRFRATKLTPVVFPQPLTFPSIAAGDSGRIWVSSFYGPSFDVGDRVVAHPRAPANMECAYRDLGGDLWLGGPAGMWHVPRGRFGLGGPITRVPLPGEFKGNVQAIARGRDGVLWVSLRGDRARAVYRRRDATWVRFLPSPRFATQYALRVVADTMGAIWLGYPNNNLVRVVGDSVRGAQL